MRFTLAIIALIGLNADQAQAQCALCAGPHSILDGYFAAEILAVCRFRNAVEPNNDLPDGQVEMVIDEVVLPHPILKNKKSLLLPYSFNRGPGQYLVSMENYKGTIDVYAAKQLDADGELLRFIRGALKLNDRSQLGKAHYAISFLHNSHEGVAESAYAELVKLDYANLRKLADKLRPQPLVDALMDRKTANGGLYPVLLSHCGAKEHANILRKLMDARALGGKVIPPGHLIGYMLMEPNAGWKYFVDVMEQDNQVIGMRSYCALPAIGWMCSNRTDICNRNKATPILVRSLAHPDSADYVVEYLRAWKRWETCDAVLDLDGKQGYSPDLMERPLIRYAIQCPRPRAAAFVEVERIRNPELVAEMEETLSLEETPEQ